MIIIHIESGLGNQMLSYCEYLSLKYANPNQEFFAETIVFEIPECNEVICQWNGYELEKIFGIKEPKNIKSLFSDDEWTCLLYTSGSQWREAGVYFLLLGISGLLFPLHSVNQNILLVKGESKKILYLEISRR